MLTHPALPHGTADGAAALRLLQLLAALFALMLLSADAPAAAEEESEKPNANSSVAGKCRDCGVLRSIREIRTERQPRNPNVYINSPQYLSTRQDDPVLIGPAVSFSWGGRNEQSQTRVGAVGSPQMQQRFIDLSYECMVKFDDGRYALIEQDDVGSLRIGDRVQVVDKRVVRVK